MAKSIRVKILKQTTANKAAARVGDVIEVSEEDGKYLIGSELAEETKEALKQNAKPKAAKSAKPSDKKDEQTPPTGGEGKPNA